MHKQPVCKPHGGTFETSPHGKFGEVSIVRPPFKNGEKRSFADFGTAHAIDYSSLGVAAHLPARSGRGGARNRADRESVAAHLPARSGRGGARNRADRESHELTADNLANLSAAERHAVAIGLPFTRMLTIHWKAAGVSLAGMTEATGRFTDLLGKWLRRNDSEAAWIWVHENGDGKGWHSHMLAHVPAALVSDLGKSQKRWLRRITSRPYRKGVIHSKPIGGRLGLETNNPGLHAANLAVAFGYLCKGASQGILDKCGFDRQHEPGGLVIGKRCSTSQNIGPKARSRTVVSHSTRARERN